MLILLKGLSGINDAFYTKKSRLTCTSNLLTIAKSFLQTCFFAINSGMSKKLKKWRFTTQSDLTHEKHFSITLISDKCT